MYETFAQDPKVQQESLDVLKYFVNHPESTPLAAEFASNAGMQDHVLAIIGD